MKFAVITFPGSNCDYDAYRAIADVLNEEAVYVWHKDRSLEGADVVILPGGFSYGDYLRPGAIARFSPIMNEVLAHARRGGPVIGICNGFQIACESGLLPGALLRNESLKFISAPACLRVENAATMFTSEYSEGQIISMPVAHGDGRYTADATTIDELESSGRVVFRYTDSTGAAVPTANPNGSVNSIAGIVSRDGNVLGMMPHPERALDTLLGTADGRPFFESVLAGVAA